MSTELTLIWAGDETRPPETPCKWHHWACPHLRLQKFWYAKLRSHGLCSAEHEWNHHQAFQVEHTESHMFVIFPQPHVLVWEQIAWWEWITWHQHTTWDDLLMAVNPWYLWTFSFTCLNSCTSSLPQSSEQALSHETLVHRLQSTSLFPLRNLLPFLIIYVLYWALSLLISLLLKQKLSI